MSERESAIEELGGRWDSRAPLPPPAQREETVVATGRDAEEWTPGLGHRVTKIEDRWVCVVCGDGWREWPTAECTGPAGVAL